MPPDTNLAELVLEARGVSKFFGDHSALLNVTLRVARGESVLLYGPNGAGKTTLLRTLSLLSLPGEGRTFLDGLEMSRHPEAAKSRIGFVSHATFLYGDLTLRENLELAGKLFGLANLEKRIDAVLETFSLQDRAERVVRSFSRGLQQRGTLARALLHDPDFLLFDEPFTGLDAESTSRLEDLLRVLPQQGKAVIFSTHDYDQGRAIARRLVMLDRGKVRFDGPIGQSPLGGRTGEQKLARISANAGN
ncbi:MAG: ABC transporter ATP-binding protein [Acidobacteriota bacterium]|nr:ABC transporter ATP-binding protein [Acidobacteriota bacterium]